MAEEWEPAASWLPRSCGGSVEWNRKTPWNLSIPVCTEGYQRLLAWAMSYGELRRAGVEGTGTYGAGLTRILCKHGVEVLEINRPDRAARRFQGKSDPTDAESAALPYCPAKLRQYPRPSPALRSPCAWCWWPDVAQSRPAPKPSIRLRLYSSARRRRCVTASGGTSPLNAFRVAYVCTRGKATPCIA
ncbi:transposase [Pseudomonas aeruginosa]